MHDDTPAGTTPAGAPTPIGGLRAALAVLAAEATDGELTVAELLAAAGTPFVVLGVGSLAQLRLLDAVESRYEVFFDLSGPVGFPPSLEALADHLATEHGVPGHPVTEHGVPGHPVTEHGRSAAADAEGPA
jgi:hypothetical protein